jgi:hypothetical protein
MDDFQNSKLFSQRAFKKSVKNSEHPDFDLDSIFDYEFKKTGKVRSAPPEKKISNKKKLSTSLNTKGNKSYKTHKPY